MPRIVSFEGRKIQVPDDASDDEVRSIIEPPPPSGGVNASAPEAPPEAPTMLDKFRSTAAKPVAEQIAQSDARAADTRTQLGNAVQRSGAAAIKAAAETPEAMSLDYGDSKLGQDLNKMQDDQLAVTRPARAETIAALNDYTQQSAPQSPQYQEMQRRIQAAGSVGAQAKELARSLQDNPDILAEMTAENILSVLGPAGAARKTFEAFSDLGKMAGAAATFGSLSAVTDSALQKDEYFNRGVEDATNPADVEARLADVNAMRDVGGKAAAHGAGVGAVDALTGGVASKVLAPASLATKPLAREVVNALAQTPVQIAGEGAGEAAGQMLADGKVDTADVLMEMAGSFGEGVTDPAMAYIGGMREEQQQQQQMESIAKVDGILQQLREAKAGGAELGVTEELQSRLADAIVEVQGGADIIGQLIDNTPPKEIPLDPERQAAVERLDPFTPEEEASLAAQVVRPEEPPPELQNDGTSVVNLDTAFGADQQIGNTQKVRNNEDNYEDNPNNAVPRSERTVLYGPAETVGKAIGSLKTQPATYVIGTPTDDRSADLLEGYYEVYEALRKQFTPNAKLVLSNESMPNRQAIGMMQALDSGEYLIVPAFARQFSATQSEKLNAGTFNANTKAKIFYNIFHEFGHVLTTERYFEGVSPEARTAFAVEASKGKISETTLAGLPPTQRAVAEAYNEFRDRLKTMNAAQFQAEWMGPAQAVQRQLINDFRLEPTASAETFVRRLVTKGNSQYAEMQAQLALSTSQEERLALSNEMTQYADALVNDYLSFDEFMAEQMARYAHGKRLGTDSKLGKSDYFSGGINYVAEEEKVRSEGARALWADMQKSLRKLFTALKRGITLEDGSVYRIAAGTAFTTWVESLSRVGQLMGESKISTEVTPGKRKPRMAKEPEKAKLPEIMDESTAKELRHQITYGRFTPGEKSELYAMLRRNEVHTLRDTMVKYLRRRVRSGLDTDTTTGISFAGLTEEQAKIPAVRNRALQEWKRKGTESPFFKAFFGDWQNEPNEASKVVAADGKPLIVYHATRANFDTFTRGDIGFHFGDLVAAHSRMYLVEPSMVQARIDTAEYMGKREAAGANMLRPKDSDWHILPVFLNIRNPLLVDETSYEQIWHHPEVFGDYLQAKGVITAEDYAYVVEQTNTLSMEGVPDPYTWFGPMRELLEEKGFDGIKYVNAVEGGTSFVAFRPEQVKTANGTFSRSSKMHMQTDVDLTQQTGLELDTLAETIKDYTGMGLTSRALRVLARSQWWVLQLQHLAWIHPEFNFLQSFSNAAQQYTAVKSSLQAAGERVAQQWRWLGKEMDAKLSNALEAEAEEGAHWTDMVNENGQWRHIMTQNTVDKLKAQGIDIETPGGKKAAQIYLQSKIVLTEQLTAAQLALAARLGQTISDSQELTMRLNEMRKVFKELRETPFLPRGDYGDWGLVVYEGLPNGGRKVVARYMYENESDLPKARAAMTKMLKPGQSISTFKKALADEQKVLLALPTEYVDMAADALQMTEDQRQQLYDLLHPVKQDKLLMPYERALDKVAGGGRDRMRNFADFVWHNSTMIARTRTMPLLNSAKQEATRMAATVNAEPMDENARQRLLSDIKRGQRFLDKTMGYMLTPPNEWYGARSTVALVYLWANLKTAMLNLVGITTTMAQATSEYGDIAGGAAMLKSHKQLALLLAGKNVDPLIEKLYSRALQEGFLNQSYSAHLAAAATAGPMKRMFNRSRWGNSTVQTGSIVAEAGMLPFGLAEQYTRRITFLTQLNGQITAAKARGSMNEESVYATAIQKTDLMQNSYTLANRPQIMRGGGAGGALVPLATIFLSFMEHMSFHALGGYGKGVNKRARLLGTPGQKSKIPHTARVLMMLIALGGYEALPGAENLLDVLDWVFMHLYGKPARFYIREAIKEIPAGWANDPRWWATGMGGDVWGFNVSKSLGIGRLIPGTDVFGNMPDTAGEVAGKVVPSMFGVAGGLGMWALQLGIDAMNGNDLTKNMTRMPGVAGNVANAVEWSKRGVRGSQGELIYEPSTKEIAGKAMGFQPSGLSDARERSWAKKEAGQFWIKQRQLLQRQYNTARDMRDREAEADVLERIQEFNGKVLDARMALRPFQLNSSYREHVRKQRGLEAGKVERRLRNLSAEIDESFNDSDESLSVEDPELSAP